MKNSEAYWFVMGVKWEKTYKVQGIRFNTSQALNKDLVNPPVSLDKGSAHQRTNSNRKLTTLIS